MNGLAVCHFGMMPGSYAEEEGGGLLGSEIYLKRTGEEEEAAMEDSVYRVDVHERGQDQNLHRVKSRLAGFSSGSPTLESII